MARAGSPSINIAIADANADSAARLRALLQEDRHIRVLAVATERSQVLPLLSLDPDIFLLSSNIEPHDTTTLVKQLLELAPHVQVLLVTDERDPADMRRAVLAGARGVLTWPIGSDELLAAVNEVYQSDAVRRERLDELARERREKATRGRVIVLFSPKGGVGCTFLASNLAVGLRRLSGKRVALVDYSIQFGTVGAVLNVQAYHNMAELVHQYEDLDSAVLNDVMVTHNSGVQVLLPPANLDQTETVTTESLIGILDGLRNHFDYVVVDTWHSLEEATVAIMEAADTLLLVSTPEVPALFAVRRFLDSLDHYPQLRYKPQLVVNRHPSKGGVGLSEIENSLGMKPVVTVPSEGHIVTAAINEGVSVLQLSVPGPAGRQLTKLAEALVVPTDLTPPGTAARNTGRRFPLLQRRTQQ